MAKRRRIRRTPTSRLIEATEARLIEIGWERTPRKVASRLAKLAGINPYTWRRWRSGDHEPMLHTWARIQTKLDKIEEAARDGTLLEPPKYRKARRTRRQRAVGPRHKHANRVFA